MRDITTTSPDLAAFIALPGFFRIEHTYKCLGPGSYLDSWEVGANPWAGLPNDPRTVIWSRSETLAAAIADFGWHAARFERESLRMMS